ncbi:hypothetical protein PVAP13_9KG548746 [Panicum virgatum]|uniref:Uncharacterized protein n=1 Tax=Panicum virgatum TaxID=38727 RepID=A0A8T0P327_PANVG|nr:hypothetical protein PVAP13_9KG548746 [Panicum virgatum]
MSPFLFRRSYLALSLLPRHRLIARPPTAISAGRTRHCPLARAPGRACLPWPAHPAITAGAYPISISLFIFFFFPILLFFPPFPFPFFFFLSPFFSLFSFSSLLPLSLPARCRAAAHRARSHALPSEPRVPPRHAPPGPCARTCLASLAAHTPSAPGRPPPSPLALGSSLAPRATPRPRSAAISTRPRAHALQLALRRSLLPSARMRARALGAPPAATPPSTPLREHCPALAPRSVCTACAPARPAHAHVHASVHTRRATPRHQHAARLAVPRARVLHTAKPPARVDGRTAPPAACRRLPDTSRPASPRAPSPWACTTPATLAQHHR